MFAIDHGKDSIQYVFLFSMKQTYSNIDTFNDKVSRLIFRSDLQALIKLNKHSGEIVARVKSRN